VGSRGELVLAALAMEHGLEILSADADFGRFPDRVGATRYWAEG
jgi:predicted nucleic acid-binding protein